MNVVELKPALPADNVASTLRKIADDIEKGDPAWPVTTAILLLAHSGSEGRPDGVGIVWSESQVRVHGIGPRVDPFTTRGVLIAGLQELGEF